MKSAMMTCLLALGFAAGCAVSEAPSAPESGLASVQVPDGFDFATTRGVQLTASVPTVTLLQVSLRSGAVLYKGPAFASGLRLSVPLNDKLLHVAASLDGTVSEADVSVVGGVAHFGE